MADSEMWMVESGAYSDYRVHFVTPDKKIAEDFVKRQHGGKLPDDSNWDAYRVSPIPVYDTPPEWWLTMWVHTSITPGDPPCEQGKPYIAEEFGTKAEQPAAETKVVVNYAGVININTSGWDHERVRKSHSERVALEYAKQQGVAS